MNETSSATREPVYIWNVEGYDVQRINHVVRASMEEMEIRPSGRLLIKPNCVAAHPVYFTHAFTRAELLDGVAAAVKEAGGPRIEEIGFGERAGITIPTRLAFHYAGYGKVIRKHGLRRYLFDEVRQVEVSLKGEGRLRSHLFTPEPVARAGFLVNCPKFKTHPWTTVTFALKNFIGIQEDAFRLIDHDYRLDEKIADLQDIIDQDLIVIDAVIAGSGRMLTPKPVPMNIVIVGKNPVATDAVCSYILNLDPSSVRHIRICADRGIGPIGLDEIEIRGDVTLDEAKERARPVEVGLARVEDFFADSPISALSGPPPDPSYSDYCWGGCPGAVEEAVDVIRQVQADAMHKARRLRIVYGDLAGKELGEREGEAVLFMGDCARFEGEVFGEKVNIDSIYREPSKKDPRKARAEDIFVKMAKVYWKMFLARVAGRKTITVRGCPVSVAEHVLLLSSLGGLKNPYFDRRVVFRFVWAWLLSKVVRLLRRLIGGLKPGLAGG